MNEPLKAIHMGSVVKGPLRTHVFICNIHKGVIENPYDTNEDGAYRLCCLILVCSVINQLSELIP